MMAFGGRLLLLKVRKETLLPSKRQGPKAEGACPSLLCRPSLQQAGILTCGATDTGTTAWRAVSAAPESPSSTPWGCGFRKAAFSGSTS